MMPSALVEEAPDAVIAVDANLRIRSWSCGAERIYGYTADEALESQLSDLVAVSQQPDEALENLEQLLDEEEGQIRSYEALRRRKDGLLIFVDITARVVHRDGKPIAILSEKDATQLRVRRDSKLADFAIFSS